MLIREDEILKGLLIRLSRWTSEQRDKKLLKAAYLFGSAVNENGLRFLPSSSDVDLIVLVDWEAATIEERLTALNLLRDAKEALEVDLMRFLERDDASTQIVSLVPMTDFEISVAIHKDGNNTIITKASAYDLLESRELCGLNPNADEGSINSQHRNCLQFVQKKRAVFLSRSANGKGGLGKIEMGEDPIPKELMRNFAVATADLDDTGIDAADIARGLGEVAQFLVHTPDWEPTLYGMKAWLEVRRGARGQAGEITEGYYIAIVEGIYNAVRKQYSGDTVAVFDPPKAANVSAVALLKPLEARFVVSFRNKLAGKVGDIERAIENARENLSFGHPEPFELVFEDARDAQDLLEKPTDQLTKAQHKKQIAYYRRRAMVAAYTARATRGTRLLLYYAGLIFPVAKDEIAAPTRVALDAYLYHLLTFGSRPVGGKWDAWHIVDYELRQPASVFQFDAAASPGAVGSTDGVAAIPSGEIASGFVPELMAALERREAAIGRELSEEELESFLAASYWQYGYH